MKLNITYLYPKELNLYGDTGNVEILAYRAKARGFSVDIVNVNSSTKLNTKDFLKTNILFMGGGPDSGQKIIYKDLIFEKGPFVKEYLFNNGLGLFICGAYQLLGEFYRTYTNEILEGLSIFDFYTQNFGNKKERCVGNTVAKLHPGILEDPVFKNVNYLNSNKLIGFENHGGRTYLKDKKQCLATVEKGKGNNGEDKTEGFYSKGTYGTYFHGPVLSKNPHFADYLIAKSLGLNTLPPINDVIVNKTHTALLNKFK